jgi:hypothetical protein
MGFRGVDTAIPVELQRPADPLGPLLDAGTQLRRELLGRPGHDAAALLILGIVLDLRARRPFEGVIPVAADGIQANVCRNPKLRRRVCYRRYSRPAAECARKAGKG